MVKVVIEFKDEDEPFSPKWPAQLTAELFIKRVMSLIWQPYVHGYVEEDWQDRARTVADLLNDGCVADIRIEK